MKGRMGSECFMGIDFLLGFGKTEEWLHVILYETELYTLNG